MSKPPEEDEAEAVLRIIEEGGVFDELRQLLISKIRENEALQAYIRQEILKCKHIPHPTADKRALASGYELIRKELTHKVMDHMVQTVWEEMNKEGSPLRKEIEEQTHKALCTVVQKRQHSK